MVSIEQSPRGIFKFEGNVGQMASRKQEQPSNERIQELVSNRVVKANAERKFAGRELPSLGQATEKTRPPRDVLVIGIFNVRQS